LRLVELPIRSGAVAYWFKGMRYRTPEVRKRQKVFVTISISTTILLSSLVSTYALIDTADKNRAVKAAIESASQPTQVVTSPIDKTGIWVTGDSVILGIRHEIAARNPIALINARVGRQAQELLEVMQNDVSEVDGSPVVFNLGNNNALTREQVVAIFEAVKTAPLRIVVNTAVPRPWRETNNDLINEVSRSYPNSYVIRWDQISMGHPEYFAPDGIHLVPAGVRAYVAAIEEYLP
jgi:hypothetical protein